MRRRHHGMNQMNHSISRSGKQEQEALRDEQREHAEHDGHSDATAITTSR